MARLRDDSVKKLHGSRKVCIVALILRECLTDGEFILELGLWTCTEMF